MTSGPDLDLEPQLAADLAESFERRVEWVGREAAARCRVQVEEFRAFEAPEVWEQVANYARATRGAVADAVRARRLPTTFPADEPAVRLAYDGGTALRSMLQSYRVGQAVAAEAWPQVISEVVEPTDRGAVDTKLAGFLFAYEDRLVEWIQTSWEGFSRSSGSSPVLLQLTRRVLEGDLAAAGELEYDLETDHFAAIAWGPDALRELTRIGVVVAGPSLIMRATEDLFWAWYSRREWGKARLDADEGTMGASSGIAIGGPVAGVEGFRRAHEEAGDAYVVAVRTGRNFVNYGEVSIEALAVQSEAASRRFVAHALGDLGAETRRADLLRATLRAYYRHGQNGAATAQELGVHEQTVARRVAAAGELLGSHPTECRAEVESALRIREVLRT